VSTDIRVGSLNASQAQPSTAKPDSGIGSAQRWPKLTLSLLTVACLVPFLNKAIHIDDPIFIWTAQQITKHPLDPYGFTATWWSKATPMWHIQQNPPGAAYYIALIGSIAGWSERALHIGFMVPAIAVILCVYRLARRFTGEPMLAALITLVAPGFLVSSTTVMCDVSMLGLWMLAIIFWVEGLEEPTRPLYLAISGVLIGFCALTKYFGVSLIPLLLAYSLVRQRGARRSLLYLLIPIMMLGGYELWTHHLYGRGHITEATSYQSTVRQEEGWSGRALAGLAFAGGCTLPALTLLPLLWSRKQTLRIAIVSALLALCFYFGWIDLGSVYQYERWLHAAKAWMSMHVFFYIAGGISLLTLVAVDYRKTRSADSLLLLLWILGTMFFAIVVNWTVSARSVLPMIPAVGILIARRLDGIQVTSGRLRAILIAVPLVISGAIALWVAAGDMAVANSARDAANYVRQKTSDDFRKPWFQGRWGFEYYMESFGARPADPEGEGSKFGDLVVVPRYNTALFKFPLKTTKPEFADFPIHTWVTSMNPDSGAGFYFSGWGPVPYVFGPVPTQQYLMARVLQEK
jgi:dolichyl-phosphate-mannose-protein mannosyltransferase